MVKHILIPSFIHNALKRNKLPLSKISDFNTMREVLSINDIVLMETLNRSDHWKTLLSINLVEEKSISFSGYNLYELWYQSATGENKTYLVNILAVLVESGQANDEIAERLFYKQVERPIDPNEQEVQPYEIVDIGPKYYGIIIQPGVFPDKDLSNKLIKDILKSMYIYCSQSEVAKSTLFELYMSRL